MRILIKKVTLNSKKSDYLLLKELIALRKRIPTGNVDDILTSKNLGKK